MKRCVLFNGEFHLEDEPLFSINNRAFCYGDGFFESMRIMAGKLPFAHEHWQRIQGATRFLELKMVPGFTQQHFTEYALALAHRNGSSNARIRFQAYRMGQGRYAPDSDEMGWCMSCTEMDGSDFKLNTKGLRMEVCTTHRINPAPQSSFKSSNALPYVLGAAFAARKGADDCFMLDSEGFIAEATASNVFLLKGNELITPDLSNGGVAGVMRQVILRHAHAAGFVANEALVSLDDVLQADECFLSNATTGIKWVAAVGKKRFFKRGAERMVAQLNKVRS